MQNVCDTLKKRAKISDATLHHSEFFGTPGSFCTPDRACRKVYEGTLFDFHNCRPIRPNLCSSGSCPSGAFYAQLNAHSGSSGSQCCGGLNKRMAAFRK